MKSIGIIAVFLVIIIITGCDKEDMNLGEFKINVNDTTYYFDTVEAYIEQAYGGPKKERLTIKFIQSDKPKLNSISFEFHEFDNDTKKLLSRGYKTEFESELSNSVRSATYSMRLEHGDITLNWNSVFENHDEVHGEGSITINTRIDYICADSIWTGHYCKPGDPEYENYFNAYCSPPDYYEKQQIRFSTD